MTIDIFKTQREFDNEFPSKMYICSNCSKVIPDKYNCMYCGWRSDGLLKTMNKGYKFVIEEISQDVQEIFKPFELILSNRKGEVSNGRQ